MTRKFTSEDLLNAMGLKVGSRIEINSLVWIVENRYHDIRLHAIGTEKYLRINEIIDLNYEILQYKPILTEDEKVILRNTKMEKIGREMVQDIYIKEYEWLYLVSGEFKYDFSMYNHIFKSIEMCGEYSIEELLKD